MCFIAWRTLMSLSRRNASSNLTNTDIATSYGAATTVSCGIAYGMGEFANKSSRLNPSAALIMQKLVPFVACAAANVFNLVLMRNKELYEGIPVKDSDGNELGKSFQAAKHALAQAGLSRAVLPAPALLFPPLIMQLVDSKRWVAPRFRPAVELAVIVSCVWGALPCAIGLFPQQASISVGKLEQQFQGLKTRSGDPIATVFFNKGV